MNAVHENKSNVLWYLLFKPKPRIEMGNEKIDLLLWSLAMAALIFVKESKIMMLML